MKGRSGDSHRPGEEEEDEESEGMREDERVGEEWDNHMHERAQTILLTTQNKLTVEPTSMSPSLESTDSRPVKHRRVGNQL